MGQVNCCEHANNEQIFTEQIETHNDFQSEKVFIKKQNTIKAAKQNKPQLNLSTEDKSIYKIQSLIRKFLVKSKFLSRFKNQKQFLSDYFKNQAIICEKNDINTYVHPKVLVIEKMIKNREGMYSNTNIPKNILQNIEYTSKYCIEMPCVYLTEVKETDKSTNRENKDNSIFDDTDIHTNVNEIQFNNYPVYKGYWSMDKKKNGYGIHINKDGSKYEGIFRNGKLEGKGRYITVKGDFFEGNFIDGYASGNGIFIHSDGSIYIGNWVRDTPWGEGQEWTADGSYYHGEFLQGKKCGVGEFKWADDSTYVGGVKNDKLNGEGLYIWSDGKKYRGFWSDNSMHGFGILEYTDGTKYEGNFENNKRSGKGKFFYNETKCYDGNWLNGKQHGKGKIIKNGKIEEGEWFEGKKIKESK